jgi:hypothetical protein
VNVILQRFAAGKILAFPPGRNVNRFGCGPMMDIGLAVNHQAP